MHYVDVFIQKVQNATRTENSTPISMRIIPMLEKEKFVTHVLWLLQKNGSITTLFAPTFASRLDVLVYKICITCS